MNRRPWNPDINDFGNKKTTNKQTNKQKIISFRLHQDKHFTFSVTNLAIVLTVAVGNEVRFISRENMFSFVCLFLSFFVVMGANDTSFCLQLHIYVKTQSI